MHYEDCDTPEIELDVGPALMHWMSHERIHRLFSRQSELADIDCDESNSLLLLYIVCLAAMDVLLSGD